MDIQIKICKAGGAGIAAQTFGRARVFACKKRKAAEKAKKSWRNED